MPPKPGPRNSAADMGWREFFQDPLLQELIRYSLRTIGFAQSGRLNVESRRALYRGGGVPSCYRAPRQARRRARPSACRRTSIQAEAFQARTQLQVAGVVAMGNRPLGRIATSASRSAAILSGVGKRDAVGKPIESVGRSGGNAYLNAARPNQELLANHRGDPGDPATIPYRLDPATALKSAMATQIDQQRAEIRLAAPAQANLALQPLTRATGASTGCGRNLARRPVARQPTGGVPSELLGGAHPGRPGVRKVAPAHRNRQLTEQAIEVAFSEVADSLAGQRTLDEQIHFEQQQVAASRGAYELANQRFTEGRRPALSLLDAQRALYGARRTLVQTTPGALGQSDRAV
ncbi:hypothetical protein FQR65_LT20730 [Abscondita terminalis]|nr:hypothetical protein FQR65_LT20730 [Abscondita terminalis]